MGRKKKCFLPEVIETEELEVFEQTRAFREWAEEEEKKRERNDKHRDKMDLLDMLREELGDIVDQKIEFMEKKTSRVVAPAQKAKAVSKPRAIREILRKPSPKSPKK